MAQLDAAAFDGLFAANVLAIFFLVAALVPAGPKAGCLIGAVIAADGGRTAV